MTAKISLDTYISTTQRDSVHLRIPFRIPALKADHMQQALDVAAEDPFSNPSLGLGSCFYV